MASINLNWISENWFHHPKKPPNFAFIGFKNLSIPKSETDQNPNPNPNPNPSTSSISSKEEKHGIYSQMLDQFYWECDHRPDFRHTPEVERILTDNPYFEKPENLTPEKIKSDLKWWEEFNKNPVIKFLRRAEVIADKMNEMELKKNWFRHSNKPSKHPNFAFIGARNLSIPKSETDQNPNPNPSTSSSNETTDAITSKEEKPGIYSRMLDQFYWECDHRPDFRHTPEVERILTDDPYFEKPENLTPEKMKEDLEWWEEFKKNPVIKFLRRAEVIADKMNEMELKENEHPYRWEDRKLWKALPHVPGPDGRPMPRKAIKTRRESDEKFWDFARQFFFGLWGFRQRPYPSSRPIDVAQAIGYKRLEKRYYDFIMRSGGWWYKDRLGRTRGPLELITLKTAWAGGVIDTHTFIWGEDMDEWAPIGMVYGLEKAIATWEVRLGAAATAFLHKLQKGMSPWTPLKGFEKKTYKELQEEALESKRRDMAVLQANGGVWPGVRTPSHALFLWASGSELTTILEADHMPNKYVSKELRNRLAKIIPGLRPWEVLSVEQAMDTITYNGEWYREPLGSYATGPPYITEWNREVKRMLRIFRKLSIRVCNKFERTIPGFDLVMNKLRADIAEKEVRRKKAREERKKALAEEAAMRASNARF